MLPARGLHAYFVSGPPPVGAGPAATQHPLAPIPSAVDPHTVERAWFLASRWSAPLYERPGHQGPRKPLDATNVRRAFRQALKDAEGINVDEWTPRELRHSFVSLLSDRGVPLEEISRLVGHSGTAVTEEVTGSGSGP